MTNANAEYVQRLRVPENATNEHIQSALHKLFDQGPQGTVLTTNEVASPQGTKEEIKSVIAATLVSRVQINDSLKNSLHSYL